MDNLVYSLPFLFIGMWVLVIFIISRMGWADLVARYRYDDPFIGTRVGIISASINNANYSNALVLRYNGEGIYLRPVLLFRLFHKAVLIPWKEIIEIRDKKILFFSLKELIVGNPFAATIKLKASTFAKIDTTFIQLP